MSLRETLSFSLVIENRSSEVINHQGRMAQLRFVSGRGEFKAPSIKIKVSYAP